jgi:hypothetical protein
MKKIALAALLAGSFGAHAEVLNFDDLSNYAVLGNYHGLHFDNFEALDTTGYRPSGYVNGVVSKSNVAFNAYGAPASISGAGFTLDSGYFTAAWTNGLNVVVDATFEDGSTVSKYFMIDSSSPSLESFNWTNLSSVTFTSSGGTYAGFGPSGEHFALDNLSVTAAVPEPGEASLLLAGLGAVALASRGRRQA